jgi:hypothetical protein
MGKPTVKTAVPNNKKTNGDKPSPAIAAVPATKPEDQKPAQAGDQKSAPKKVITKTVAAWRAQKAFEPTLKIYLLRKDNPKRAKAAVRFSLYKDAMTVQQYIDIMKDQTPSRTAKATMADIRWDVAAGFIEVK